MVIRWKDKDRRELFERVKNKFVQLVKLRVNVVCVDPMIKIKKRQELLQKKNEKEQRKIEKKRKEKEIRKMQTAIVKKTLTQGQRAGLRSRSSVLGGPLDLAPGAEMESMDVSSSA